MTQIAALLKSPRMKLQEAIVQAVARLQADEIDLHDILSYRTDVPVEVVEFIQDRYDSISSEHFLHADDDFEGIENRLFDSLVADYGE